MVIYCSGFQWWFEGICPNDEKHPHSSFEARRQYQSVRRLATAMPHLSLPLPGRTAEWEAGKSDLNGMWMGWCKNWGISSDLCYVWFFGYPESPTSGILTVCHGKSLVFKSRCIIEPSGPWLLQRKGDLEGYLWCKDEVAQERDGEEGNHSFCGWGTPWFYFRKNISLPARQTFPA